MPVIVDVMIVLGLLCFAYLIVCLVKTHKHNHKHEWWESRIVKTELGKYQVQSWQHDSADWYGEDKLDWYPIRNFGFHGKSTYDTLEEAQAAKAEYDKKVYENEHCDKVAEVIEGPKE